MPKAQLFFRAMGDGKQVEFLEIYHRYFRKEEEETGYCNDLEYLSDCIQMLDAYIFTAFERKRLESGLEEERHGKTAAGFGEIQEIIYPELLQQNNEYREYLQQEFYKIRKYFEGRLKATAVCEEIPFYRFISALKLSPFQSLCLILAAAFQIDQKYGKIFACLSENPSLCYPTRGLALFLYEIVEEVSLEEYRELMFGGDFYSLCFKGREENAFWAQDPLFLRPELLSYFLGMNLLSKTIRGDSWLFDRANEPEELLVYQREKQQLLYLEKQKTDVGRMITIVGRKGSGKKFLLTHLAYETNQNMLFLDGKQFFRLYQQMGEELLWILRLELLIREAGVCLCDFKVEREDRLQAEELFKELAAGGMSFYLTAEAPLLFSLKNQWESYELFLPRPTVGQRALLWKHFISSCKKDIRVQGELLANRYELNAGEIKNLVQNAKLNAESKARDFISEEDMAEAVKRRNEGIPGNFVNRIDAVFTWEDLVVPESVLSQLKRIGDQVKYRSLVGEEWGFYEKRPYGRGICALFYGPPGTGKTMAVQVLANDLGLTLYRVDLSRMLSKYIGETQKNISALFDQVKESNALLFFDEADAFFSKRTEVTNSNDRNANGETAHLLQCLEEYEGISVLATNLKDNMDDAYKRRMQFMVPFQAPDVEIRKKLWKKLIPNRAPVENLQLDFFAENFEMTGSEIKDAIWNAAFMAAAEGTAIKNRHLSEAVRLNYEKYGRILTKEELDYGIDSL